VSGRGAGTKRGGALLYLGMAAVAPNRGNHGSMAVTYDISVRAEPCYDAQQSVPEESKFLFRYSITIDNGSRHTVQLLTRSWLIIDGGGEEHRVDGDGVVGLQPILKAGETFEYSSFCPLRKRWGTMEGSFTMRREDGTMAVVRVGRFYLVQPESVAAGKELG